MADEKWNMYRNVVREAAARTPMRTRAAQDPNAHAQVPHHTKTMPSYRGLKGIRQRALDEDSGDGEPLNPNGPRPYGN